MRHIPRRTFLRRSAVLASGAAFARRSAAAAVAGASGAAPAPETIGKVKPRPGVEIAASPLGVGFETLDRKMFEPERTYDHVARLGAKWARMQTGWARCEPVRGRYEFGWLDSVVDRLRAVGVQPWFNLGYGNPIYSPESPDPAAVGWIPIGTEDARQGWVRFTRALAEHFRDRVKHWEIWNEPNHRNFWKPHEADPAQYVGFVKMTAPVIREAVPGALVIGPAVWGPDYFRRCFELGLGELVDRVSYHWYRPTPEFKYEEGVAECRAVARRHGADRPFWQGESGCPSQPGSAGAMGRYDWTEDLQARWLLRRTMNDLRLRIEMTSYFHMADILYASRPEFGMVRLGGLNTKGLLRREDYSPKPSYFAYQCLCALFDADTRRADDAISFEVAGLPPTSPLGQDAVLQASFVRGRHPLHVYWLPLDLLKELPRQSADVRIRGGAADGLDAPVLIDPLRATVHRLAQARRAAGGWEIPGAPLADYPLIIAERAAVALAGAA